MLGIIVPNQCSNDYTYKCKYDKYKTYDECILHCDKNEISSLSNPYFIEPQKFCNHLVDYITNQIFEICEEETDFNKNYLLNTY